MDQDTHAAIHDTKHAPAHTLYNGPPPDISHPTIRSQPRRWHRHTTNAEAQHTTQDYNLPRRRHKATTTTTWLRTRLTEYTLARRPHQQHIRRRRDPPDVRHHYQHTCRQHSHLHTTVSHALYRASNERHTRCPHHESHTHCYRIAQGYSSLGPRCHNPTHDDQHALLGVAANFLDHDTLQRHAIPMPSHRAA